MLPPAGRFLSNKSDPTAKIGSRRKKLDYIVLASLFWNCDQPVQKIDADPVLVAGGLPRWFGSRRCPNAGTPIILPAMGGGIRKARQLRSIELAGLGLEALRHRALGVNYIRAAAIPPDIIDVIGLVCDLSHRRDG
jgi:hypothetical protein